MLLLNKLAVDRIASDRSVICNNYRVKRRGDDLGMSNGQGVFESAHEVETRVVVFVADCEVVKCPGDLVDRTVAAKHD